MSGWLPILMLISSLWLRAELPPTPSKGSGSVGTDIKELGEKVANRVDRVIKKKAFEFLGDPWTFQGIPLVFPTDSSGFNVGAKVQLQDIVREDPHEMEIEAQMLTSDQGRYKHSLRLDLPHAFGGKYRVTTRLAYDRDISFRYYGIGNNTVVDRSLLDNSPYYSNVRAGPSLTLHLLKRVDPYLRLGPILGLKWTAITAPPGSLLLSESPVGIAGGRTHYIGGAFVYDTTDFEPYPSRGSAHEYYLYFYGPFSGSNYNFLRSTYTYRRYFPLHRQLILAQRTLFEVLSGQIPYYEMGGVGGVNPTIGFGGDRYMRGYDANRFIEPIRLAAGLELRWDPIFFGFAKQDITIGFVPWFDIGRVWSKVWPLDVSRFHASMGWGARMIWNSRFVIRTDFAVTSEGTLWIINLGNSF